MQLTKEILDRYQSSIPQEYANYLAKEGTISSYGFLGNRAGKILLYRIMDFEDIENSKIDIYSKEYISLTTNGWFFDPVMQLNVFPTYV